MNQGKLLRIQDDWSVYIIEDENGDYLRQNGLIYYRSVGKDYDIRIINDLPYEIDKNGMVQVFNAAGKPNFHFPIVWLDTTTMKIQRLIELGVLKTNNN